MEILEVYDSLAFQLQYGKGTRVSVIPSKSSQEVLLLPKAHQSLSRIQSVSLTFLGS